MAGEGGGAVSFYQTGMPPHLLRLFEARPPLARGDAPKRKRPVLPYSGVGDYIKYFKKTNPKTKKKENAEEEDEEEDTRDHLWINPELGLQCRVDHEETRVERIISRIKRKGEDRVAANEEALKVWDPHADPNVEGEPLNTLFVAHLSDDVSERKLRREFETFGPIKRIRVVHDKYSGKPKGYAFIEFEDKEDMKEAYKVADGTRIEGTRCVVDVERGRTVPNWKPKRLGGGAQTGERHEATLPRDPQKQVIAKRVFQALGLDIKPPVLPKKTLRAGRDAGYSDRWKRDRYDDTAGYRGGRDFHSRRPRDDYSSRRHSNTGGSRYRDDYDDYRLTKRGRGSYGDDMGAPQGHYVPSAGNPQIEVENGEHSPEEGELA